MIRRRVMKSPKWASMKRKLEKGRWISKMSQERNLDVLEKRAIWQEFLQKVLRVFFGERREVNHLLGDSKNRAGSALECLEMPEVLWHIIV